VVSTRSVHMLVFELFFARNPHLQFVACFPAREFAFETRHDLPVTVKVGHWLAIGLVDDRAVVVPQCVVQQDDRVLGDFQAQACGSA
jgi:hypothetical protein